MVLLGDAYCVLDSRIAAVPVSVRYWYRNTGAPPNVGLHLVTVRFDLDRYPEVRAWVMATYGEPIRTTMEPWAVDFAVGASAQTERAWWTGPTTGATLSRRSAFGGPKPLERVAGYPSMLMIPKGWAPPQ